MPHRDVDLQKVLILRFSSLGDIVMITAMIRCLRAKLPFARIDMVVREDFLPLIENNPHLDKTIGLNARDGLSGLFRLWRTLRREGYDLIYDAHCSLRSVLLTSCLRSPNRAVYRKHYLRRAVFLTFKLPLLKDGKRMLQRYLEPLRPFGVIDDGKGPEFHLPNRLAISSIRRLRVGIIASAHWPGKRWPFFRELMQMIVLQTDWEMTVFGGPSDNFCGGLVSDLPSERISNRQGELGLTATAHELSQCNFVISNDTGLMHLADALGIPCVLILGPTSKELGCLPFHRQSRIVERDLWCRPCSKNGQAICIRGKRHCLDIPVSHVFTEALVLSQTLHV